MYITSHSIPARPRPDPTESATHRQPCKWTRTQTSRGPRPLPARALRKALTRRLLAHHARLHSELHKISMRPMHARPGIDLGRVHTLILIAELLRERVVHAQDPGTVKRVARPGIDFLVQDVVRAARAQVCEGLVCQSKD